MAVLLGGLPVEVAGQTVNRLCGSGLQAINAAARAIAVGDSDVFIAGGVQIDDAGAVRAQQKSNRRGTAVRHTCRTRRSAGGSSTRSSPRCTTRTRWARPPRTWWSGGIDPRMTSRASGRTPSRCCRTSERSRPSRAACSTRRSSRSVPPQKKGDAVVVARDEHPRADTSMEALAKLRPAFRDGGSVTAGTRRASTTARRRRSSSRQNRRGRWACGRWRGWSRPRGRGRRSGDHGRQVGAGLAQGARAGGHRGHGPRPRGAQRGVRVAVGRLHRRAGPRSGEGQRQRRRDRAGPSFGRVRRSTRDHAGPRLRRRGGPLRPRDDVHRRRARASRRSSSRSTDRSSRRRGPWTGTPEEVTSGQRFATPALVSRPRRDDPRPWAHRPLDGGGVSLAFDIGNYKIQILLGFAFAFGAIAQLLRGSRGRSLALGGRCDRVGRRCLRRGSLRDDDGRADPADHRRALAFDEALLGGLLGGLVAFSAAWFLTRAPSPSRSTHRAAV